MAESNLDTSQIREANPEPLESEKALGRPFGSMILVLIILMLGLAFITFKKPAPTEVTPPNTSPSYQMEQASPKKAELATVPQAQVERQEFPQPTTPAQDDPWSKFKK